MSNSLFVAANSTGNGFVDATPTTDYFAVAGFLSTTGGGESAAEIDTPVAGTFSNLYVYVPTNTASVTSVLTLRKSTVDTALTVSYTSDQTGVKEDTSNTVSFANTDAVAWKMVVPTEVGTNTLTVSMVSCQFTPDNGSECISFLRSRGGNALTLASTTTYLTPNGRVSADGLAEPVTKYRIRSPFVSSNLYTYVLSTGRTTDVVIKTRKNGADGNQSITYAGLQGGTKEDTSNTDSLAAGDDYNYSVTTSTGGGTTDLYTIATTLTSTNNQFVLLSGRPGGTAIAAGVTSYIPISGDGAINATEINVQTLPRFDFTLRELGVYISANTNATLSFDVFVRDNGADSALTVSYAVGQTGLKSDSSHAATITSGSDEINYKVVNNDGSGSITLNWISVLGETAGATTTSTSSSTSTTTTSTSTTTTSTSTSTTTTSTSSSTSSSTTTTSTSTSSSTTTTSTSTSTTTTSTSTTTLSTSTTTTSTSTTTTSTSTTTTSTSTTTTSTSSSTTTTSTSTSSSTSSSTTTTSTSTSTTTSSSTSTTTTSTSTSTTTSTSTSSSTSTTTSTSIPLVFTIEENDIEVFFITHPGE